MKKTIVGIFLSSVILLSVTHAQSLGGFTIDGYTTTIYLQSDGYMTVQEDIKVNFSEDRHGIYRKIPVYGNQTVSIENLIVNNFEYSNYHEGNYYVSRIGSADSYVNGLQNYEIQYQVYGGVRQFSGYQELYWNIVGLERDTSIANIAFIIYLPSALNFTTGDWFVYYGPAGAKETDGLDINFNQDTVQGTFTRSLSNNQALTIGLKFPDGYFTLDTGRLENLYGGNGQDNQDNIQLISEAYKSIGTIGSIVLFGFLGIPILVFLFLFSIRKKYGKDEKLNEVVEYYPPEGMNPVQAGYLIDDKLDNQDMFSLIYYRATNGYITIKEEETKILFFKNKDYMITKIKDLPKDAKEYEKSFFEKILFVGENKIMRISELKNDYTIIIEIKNIIKEIEKDIKEGGFYTKESIKIKKKLVGFMIGTGVLAFILGFTVIGPIVFVISTVIMGIFYTKMLKKTPEGLKLFYHLKGYKTFIKTVEKAKLEQLLKDDPTYFDKVLPFAVVFGLSTQFLNKCEGLLQDNPSRYTGNSNTAFILSLNSCITNMSSTLNKSSGSSGSGSSGFSGGGGSSGGGGGGGGGGSW